MKMNSFFSVTTLAILSFCFSSSCMKVPNLEDNDGPEASLDAVQTSLINAWGTAQPDSIRMNEFAATEKNIALSDSSSRPLLQEGKTVQKVDETSTDKTYTILQQTVEYADNNQSKSSTDQRVIVVKKAAATDPTSDPAALGVQQLLHSASGPLHTNALGISIETLYNLLLACKKDANWDVSCHNLKVWDSVEDPPSAVKQSSDCRGLKDCKVHKKNVAFDLILNTVDESNNTKVRQKIIYTAKISPDVPYLSRLTDFCIQGLIDINKQKLPVTICQTIQDFQVGTP